MRGESKAGPKQAAFERKPTKAVLDQTPIHKHHVTPCYYMYMYIIMLLSYKMYTSVQY